MARTTRDEDLREQDLMLAHGDISEAYDGLAVIIGHYPHLKRFADEIEAKLKSAQCRIRAKLDRGQAARNQRKASETGRVK